MLSFLAGQDITITLDPSLTGLEATALQYRVVDHEGIELVPKTAVPGWTPGTEASIVVPALLNAVPTGKTQVARTLTLYVTGTGGASAVSTLDSSYRVVVEDRLPIPEASFLTLVGAEMIAEDMASLVGWKAADDKSKTAALMESREDINRLSFRYEPGDWQSRISRDFAVDTMSEMTASEWAALEPAFRNALQRAQVLQADAILARTSDDLAQEKGVTQIVIGESSRTFKNTRVGRPVVADRALRVLGPYLAPRRIARA